MNGSLPLLDPLWATRLGWALLHSLWQGALAAAAWALLRLALRRSSAQARYVAGCAMLGALAVAPVLTLVWHTDSPGVSVRAPGAGNNAGGALGATSVFAAGPAVAVPRAVSILFWQAAGALEHVAPWLVAGWVVGVLIFSIRLLHGCHWVRRLKTSSDAELDPSWLELLEDLKLRLAVSRPVRLMNSALVEVPSVVGWFRPVILLPASTMTGLAPAELEAILAHELAHLRRYDYWVNAFQTLIETLLFYHPAVWWISNCVREEREHCCDDLVVSACGNRVAYARALATLEERRVPGPSWAFAASGSPLLHRVRRVLGVSDEHRPASRLELTGLTLLSLGLACIVAGICLWFGPTTFRAVARVRTERDFAAQLGAGDGRFMLRWLDPYFSQTESALISSPSVLDRVVEELRLTDTWGRRYRRGQTLSAAEACQWLRARLSLVPVRNTTLMEIRVQGEESEETARIANAVAVSYRDYRMQQRATLAANGLKVLDARVREQDEKVRQAQAEVDQLRRELNLPETVGDAPDSASLRDPETLRRLESLRIESRSELVRQETLVKRLKELPFDNLIQAIPTAAQDPLLNSLLEQRDLSEQKLVGLRLQYGPQHPEVVAVTRLVEDLNQKIKSRVEGILIGLDVKVASLNEGLSQLEKDILAATQREVEKQKQARPYFDAKRKLDEALRFRQVLTMKVASETLDTRLPQSSTVEIVDQATPPFRPVAPNRPRAAALMVFGLLLGALGLLLVKREQRALIALKPA